MRVDETLRGLSLGARLKETAKRVGLTAPELGKRLDRSATQVYNWWNDTSVPAPQVLLAYSKLVGVKLEHLIPDTEPVRGVYESPAAVLYEWLRRVNAGEDPAEALEGIGRELAPEEAISEQVVSALRGAGDRLRASLLTQQGEQFAALSEEQRLAVLRIVDLFRTDRSTH